MHLPLTFFTDYSLAVEDVTQQVTSTALLASGACGCGEHATQVGTAEEYLRTDADGNEVGRAEVPESEEVVRWKGIIGVEGELTGDGRFIQPGALRWEGLPLPFRYVSADVGAHAGAVVSGRITNIWREEPGEDGTVEVWGEGDFDMGSVHGKESARLVEKELQRGVSMDLDDVAFEVRIAADAPALIAQDPVALVSEGEQDEDGRVKVQEMSPDDEVMVTTDARIRAATQVAVPAFSRALISIDKGEESLAASAAPDVRTLALRLGGVRFEVEYDASSTETFNWVEDVGGLPEYIDTIADAIRRKNPQMSEGHTIAIAVNAVKKMCATGDINFPGDQDVNPGSRAAACAAVAEWEEKKARAKADSGEVVVLSERKGIGGYPIDNCEDLKDAIQAVGRARPEDREATIAHIKSAKKELGCTDVSLPDGPDWATSTQTFGYDDGQWRNPDNGQWIDMPNVALDRVAEAVQSALGDLDEERRGEVSSKVESILGGASDGVAPDDENAPRYDEKIDKANLQGARDAIDSVVDTIGNDPEVSEDKAQAVKDAADNAHEAIDAYENFYIAEEQTDIGAGDEDDLGELETDEGNEIVAPSGDIVPADGDEMNDEDPSRGNRPVDDVVMGLPSGDDVSEYIGEAMAELAELIKSEPDNDDAFNMFYDLADLIQKHNIEAAVDRLGKKNGGIPEFIIANLSESLLQALDDEGFSLRAAAAPADTDLPPLAHFQNPNFKMPTPLTVTRDGRVMGHLAIWGTCHLTHTNAGKCVTPPKSPSGYAYFATGAVLTKEGAEIPVGQITLGTGHAAEAMNAKQTLAHYDNTGKAVADITVGEDAYGIWFSGSLRPGVSAKQVRTLRAHPLSGDWRRMAGHLELVATLCVNVQGFPVPRPKGRVSNGSMHTLVAAGMLPPRKVRRPFRKDGTRDPEALSVEDLRYLKRLAAREKAQETEEKMQTLAAADALAKRLRATQRDKTLMAARRIKVQQMAARLRSGA
jgi:hypothetical protein